MITIQIAMLTHLLDDEIQFQINAANFNDYLSYLTDGQVEMFNIHPESFVMNIYPSRRSCAVPQEVLDLTKEGNVQMIADGEGVEGVVGGNTFSKCLRTTSSCLESYT